MDRYVKLERARAIAMHWFSALTIGSFGTSAGVYFAYNHWEPMVWSAGAIGVIHVIRNFKLAVDGE